MVSNFERIFGEIRKGAHQIARDHGLEPEAVVKLIMAVVDLEDRNRVKAVAGIDQEVRGMIQNVSQTGSVREDA